MPITINGSGTLTGISSGGLPDGIITPAELSTGGPSWDTTGNLTNITAINSGPLAGIRNKIINGAMDISQRGTSFAAANGYTLDRFVFAPAGGGVATVTQSTDAPNNTFRSSLKVDVTTADTSIAAGDYVLIEQRIEGYNVRDLIGQTFTLSFWVKSPKTGTHCVSFRNSVADRSYVVEYTVSAANTWEYKIITVTGGLITAGTWDWTTGIGLLVGFTLAAGSTYQTTAGAWQTANYIGTANQVNCMDSVANDFFLTGVQLEIGSTATPFERRPIGVEVGLCQRYYETTPATISWRTSGVSAGDVGFYHEFKVQKRAVPTVGFTGLIYDVNSSALNTGEIQVYGFRSYWNSGNATIHSVVTFGYTASAEL